MWFGAHHCWSDLWRRGFPQPKPLLHGVGPGHATGNKRDRKINNSKTIHGHLDSELRAKCYVARPVQHKGRLQLFGPSAPSAFGRRSSASVPFATHSNENRRQCFERMETSDPHIWIRSCAPRATLASICSTEAVRNFLDRVRPPVWTPKGAKCTIHSLLRRRQQRILRAHGYF